MTAAHVATPANWKILHPKPYRKGPTPVSVRRAAELGIPLDIDIRACRGTRPGNGRLVGLHNRIPGQERYRYTAASIKAGVPKWKKGRLVTVPIASLPAAVVWTLRTREGDRIWPIDRLVEVAGEVDAELEFEPKVTLTVQQLENLRAVCIRAFGPDRWKQMTWVKKLIRVFGVAVPWRTLLHRARAIGFRTIALRVGTDERGRSLPVTHYRK